MANDNSGDRTEPYPSLHAATAASHSLETETGTAYGLDQETDPQAELFPSPCIRMLFTTLQIGQSWLKWKPRWITLGCVSLPGWWMGPGGVVGDLNRLNCLPFLVHGPCSAAHWSPIDRAGYVVFPDLSVVGS